MKDFRDNIVCVNVSTFLIFMFVDQLLLLDAFSQLYYRYLTYANKTTMVDFCYKYCQNHDKSIFFSDFHQFSFSFDKTHLITANFY